MSGFAGVWHFDGRPIQRQLIAALGSSVAHRGGDSDAVWCGSGVGFAAHVRRVVPESADERQPAIDVRGNVLVFDGRLDNRDDLLRQLAESHLTPESSDAEVVLASLRAWGEVFLERIVGDFGLAAFLADDKRLVLARDPVGCRPLYYWCDARTFVFGSEIKALLAHPDVRREPNLDLIADFLLRDHLPYDDEGDTFFRGVRALLPGHQLTVTARGLTSRRFWDFNPQDKTRYRSYADYADRLRELLTQAVTRRLRTSGPAALAISGGLDSSVVFCIAHHLRERGTINIPLRPVWCMSEHRSGSEEERFVGYLESTLGVRIDRVAMAPLDRESAGRATWHSEWPRFDMASNAMQPMFVAARQSGARTILTGQWSDQLFFVTGYLSDLFVRLAWRQIARHLREYQQWFVDANPEYFHSRFRRELLLNLTPHAWRARMRRFLKTAAPDCSRPLVSAAIAGRLNRQRARIKRPRCASAHARDIYQFVRSTSHRLQFEADEKLATNSGLDSVTPFLDRDLIAYLMSIPGEIQNRGGVPRALLRDAMRGIVADEILARRWRDGSAFTINRAAAYLSPSIQLEAASGLGLVQHAATVDPASIDLLGLEFWSRVFFSDRLASLRPSPRGVTEPMDTVVTPDPDDREKLPYSPPRLTIHGDLRKITAAKQSDRTEAGQPKTFNSGMP
jgi:asparagine synthase (glutamine-hydrolysing)